MAELLKSEWGSLEVWENVQTEVSQSSKGEDWSLSEAFQHIVIKIKLMKTELQAVGQGNVCANP